MITIANQQESFKDMHLEHELMRISM